MIPERWKTELPLTFNEYMLITNPLFRRDPMQMMQNAEAKLTAAYAKRVKKFNPMAIVAIFTALMELMKNCQQDDPVEFLKEKPVIGRWFIRREINRQNSRYISVDDAVESIAEVVTSSTVQEQADLRTEIDTNTLI